MHFDHRELGRDANSIYKLQRLDTMNVPDGYYRELSQLVRYIDGGIYGRWVAGESILNSGFP